MLAELFELWSTTVKKSAEVQIVNFDRTKDRIVVLPDGKVTVTEADLPNVAHVAADLNTILAVIEFKTVNSMAAEVWYSRGGVRAILDATGHRRNSIVMPLSLSVQMKTLSELDSHRKPLTQKALLSLLRLTFHAAGLGNLPAMLGKVKFSVNRDGESEIAKDKRSVGMSHLAQFHGFADIPDVVPFHVPAFANGVSIPVVVRVAIEPDPETQTFQLIPLAGEIEAALGNAETILGEMLRGIMPDGVPVLLGSP